MYTSTRLPHTAILAGLELMMYLLDDGAAAAAAATLCSDAWGLHFMCSGMLLRKLIKASHESFESLLLDQDLLQLS